METGLIIRQLRRSKNWTQDDLADRLGVKKQMVSHYETGTNKPNVEKLKQIAEIFDVELSTLLSESIVSKAESDSWAQKTVDSMQNRINALEEDKKYLQQMLELVISGKGNFLKGNIPMFTLFKGGNIPLRLSA
jgi:transcriptional regulator with XRE-family HTH domain